MAINIAIERLLSLWCSCLVLNGKLLGLIIAASAHARAAIYFEIDKEFPCRFVWMDGWMDGVYANEELACVQTLFSTARESQIGTRYTSLIRNFRVRLFVGMDGWSICK